MKYEKLKEILEGVQGGTFLGLDTSSTVKLRGGKKNEQQGRVVKITKNSNVMCFANTAVNSYESMVKRRLAEEGKDTSDFTVGPRKWGTRIENTPFIEHKGNHYLEVIFMSKGSSEYLLDGVVVEEDEIEGLPTPRPVTEESQGGVNKKVIIRTYDVDSIVGLRAGGKEYELE